MTDFTELEFLFEQFIEADSNPFILKTKSVYKRSGQLQTKVEEKNIELIPTTNILLDILTESEKIWIELYPKNFFNKLFQSSRVKKLNAIIDSHDDSWISVCSEQTSTKLKKFGVICQSNHNITLTDKILIAKRDKLIFRKSDQLFEFSVDWSNYKVIHII